MEGQDILQPISNQEIPKLLSILKEDFPSSVVVYHFVVMQLRWAEKIPKMRVRVLCPHGVCDKGMVVCLVSNLALEDKEYGVVYARQGDEALLASVLLATRAIPWHNVMHFGGLLERHFDAVKQAIAAAGVILPKDQPPLSYLLVCPNKFGKEMEPLSLNIEGVRLANLEPRHLEEVWNLRPQFPDYYKPVIAACLEHNVCVGIFVTLDDGSEKLASMALQSEYGGFSMGQTHPDYLRRGYSNILAYHIVCGIFDTGVQAFGWTAVQNTNMAKFSKKYGVPFFDKCMRLLISPYTMSTQLQGHL